MREDSRYGRRITANTPVLICGPAAGHPLMRTNEYQIEDTATTATGRLTDGRRGFGTLNNCANGVTPWGTYLTCEENWNGNFGVTGAFDTSPSTELGKLNRRYGLVAAGFG